MAVKQASPSDQVRLNLVGIIDVCPIEHCNPRDCPLFHLRKLKRSSRLRWLATLDEVDVRYIDAYHQTCQRIKRRRAALLARQPL